MGAPGGLVVVHQLSEEASEPYFKQVNREKWFPVPQCLSLYDATMKAWRQLPPIPAVAPLWVLHDGGIASVGKKLFVMGGWDPQTDAASADVYELDLGSSLWEWQKRRRMHTARCFFFCTAVSGKIYVVGGMDSPDGNEAQHDLLPEAYDVETDTWEVLPSVMLPLPSPSSSVQYRQLAVVAGSQVMASGYCDLGNFSRIYDPVSKRWEDWECADVVAATSMPWSEVSTGQIELHDGCVHVLDRGSKKWRKLEGQVSAKTWRWEDGQRVDGEDSTCAHTLVDLSNQVPPRVYVTICEHDLRFLTMWRGGLDYAGGRVMWSQIQLPGSLYMCGKMCYVQED